MKYAGRQDKEQGRQNKIMRQLLRRFYAETDPVRITGFIQLLNTALFRTVSV